MRKWIAMTAALLFSAQALGNTCQWQEWRQFKQLYIEDGRVIDASDPRLISTSEGQSYGLFFALVANDKKAFSQLLNWTQDHLAGGDITARLPAWLWGRQSNGRYAVIDSNPASDSDLWIAYSLAEAGRLWDNYYYQSLAHLLAARILREETAEVDGIGTVLLPAPAGFENKDGSYRINPSYIPLQLAARMADLYPQYQWQSMYQTSYEMIRRTMPKGFSPDWATLQDKRYLSDRKTADVGSYNAIRTYLWAGMLNDAVPEKTALIQLMQPMVTAVQSNQVPPESVNTKTAKYHNRGNPGFSAALLPLLVSAEQPLLAKQQAERAQNELQRDTAGHYYDNVLALFGEGWYQKRFRFAVNGQLQPNWNSTCQ
ncbi:cellulose synthase complex periplasmic endoglucanase BcsZ [Psychromonas aquimarina]|uniref:cellulose synthase complex periplasmic endoglucanase BcsZ n=1 Tax=Psychromonas aquimarina TaxID=444919 RepID=UPI00041FEFA3|nr:cellulose synthase complex periplasmic endoglucanase BcsZ [Psychromonas aquimarina]